MTVNIIEEEKQPLTLTEIYNTWYKLKTRYPDALVLLRIANQYFSFESDADAVDGLLQREPLPPWKERQVCQLHFYDIDKLIDEIIKVHWRAAICEPLYSPSTRK